MPRTGVIPARSSGPGRGHWLRHQLHDRRRQGERVTKLRLDARLLAKLITESYPAETPSTRQSQLGSDQCGNVIANNPVSITDDPEFIALNPGLSEATDTEASAY